jgi:hypothetical protein
MRYCSLTFEACGGIGKLGRNPKPVCYVLMSDGEKVRYLAIKAVI